VATSPFENCSAKKLAVKCMNNKYTSNEKKVVEEDLPHGGAGIETVVFVAIVAFATVTP
jgi:hypothetical protein